MDLAAVQSALREIREIKGSQVFYDVHVHPFEVMYESRLYQPVPDSDGLFSAGQLPYVVPSLGELSLEENLGSNRPADSKLRSMASLFNARKVYSHTGPAAIGDQMRLAIVDRAVLLPVLKKSDSGDDQFRDLDAMFGGDDRFLFGYCLPTGIPDEQVVETVGQAVDRQGVRVLKLHPSITGIDLGTPDGVRRVEVLLEASRQHRLKVIVHGGLSPECPDRQAATYGTVANLQRVDWSLTPETVIIAHGGCFGYPSAEARAGVVPTVLKLLARHENLAIDTSALRVEVLCSLLEGLDFGRVYFGSDALYEKEWGAMVILWWALRQTGRDCEQALLQIAGSNPSRLFSA